MWRAFEGGLFVDDLQEGAQGAQSHAALILVFLGTYAERAAKDIGCERHIGVARGIVAIRFNFGPHVLELFLVQTNTALLCTGIRREELFTLHHNVYGYRFIKT